MNKTTIAEACELHARIGWQGLTKKEYLDDGEYYLVTGVDFAKGHINFAGCHYVTKDRYDQDAHIQLRLNDVLVTKDGTIGKVAIIDEPIDKPATLNSGVFVVRPKDPEKLHPRFLMLVLQSNDFTAFIERIKVGCTIAHLNQEKFLNYEFPLPSMSEQQEAIDVFDKLFAVIDTRQQQLAALDDLIKARFVELFGNGHDGVCKTEKLGDFCKFQQGTQVPVEDQVEEKMEGYTRFLRIIDYTQAPQEPRYVSVKGREIAEDSVVIVRYGATAGFVGHGYAGILANNLFEVVPDESVLSKDFLYLALKYGTFEKEVHDKAFGAAMPALSFGMMKDIGVVAPNSSEQNDFVKFVKQVDKSKVAVQKALDGAQLLFNSLMQKYFG